LLGLYFLEPYNLFIINFSKVPNNFETCFIALLFITFSN